MEDRPLVYYHGDCPDGWCAAYVAHLRHPDAELVPCRRGSSLAVAPDGRDVLMVDYSLSRDEMVHMNEQAHSLRVFDHHKTAAAVLAGLPFATFDMERSGAGLTFDYLLGDDSNWRAGEARYSIGGPAIKPLRPWWVSYTEDRDLWRHKLPDTREINAYLTSFPYTVEAWDRIRTAGSDVAVAEGRTILRNIEQFVDRVLDQRQTGRFFGYRTFVVNTQYQNISEVLGVGVERDYGKIGLGWFVRGDGKVQFSLRSRGELDVSALAATFGGGGHRNAAGFVSSLLAAQEWLSSILHYR